MCKVSVIIYVKNTVNYIEQCIRSVVSQTLRDIEVLVVDGGSTDGTLDILKSFKEVDNRIKLFQSEPSVGAQFNLAMKNANGEYIAICEADDYISEDMYERQYEIAHERDIDVLLAAHYQFCTVDVKEHRFKIEVPINENQCDRLIICEKGEFVNTGAYSCWSGIYKRKFLVDNNIRMNETLGAAYQDVSFTFLANFYAKRVWVMSDPFYFYRVDNQTSLMYSPNCIPLCIEEYNRLKTILQERKLLNKYIGAYISWKLWSFYGFIHDLGRDNSSVYLENLYEILQDDYKLLMISRDSATIKNAEPLIRSLGEDMRSFEKALFEGIDEEERTKTFFSGDFSDNNPIGLLGLGKMGELVMEYAETFGIKLILIDNNPDYQKNGYKGKTVLSPNTFAKKYTGHKCIVASIYASKEMREQLKENGILEDNIITCNNMYTFIKYIFARGRNN